MLKVRLPKCAEPWSVSMNLFDLMKEITEVPMDRCNVCETLVLPWQIVEYGWCDTAVCQSCADQIEEDWQTYKSKERD
jgi:hypothetical protein